MLRLIFLRGRYRSLRFQSDIINEFTHLVERECLHRFRVETVSFDHLSYLKRRPIVRRLENDMKVVVAQDSISGGYFPSNTIDIITDITPNGDQFLRILKLSSTHIDLANIG